MTHLLYPYPSIHRVSFARCLMPAIAKTCQSSVKSKVKDQAIMKVTMREREALQIFLKLQPEHGRRKPQIVRMRTLLQVKLHKRRRE